MMVELSVVSSQVVEMVDSSDGRAVSLVAVDALLTVHRAVACIVRKSSRRAIGKPLLRFMCIRLRRYRFPSSVST